MKSQLDKLNEKIRKCRDSMFDTRLAATLSNSEEQRTQKLNEYKVIKKNLMKLMIERNKINGGEENDKYKRR